MNREEFLRGLQNALSGEVPPSVVRDNLRYYDNYIRSEIQKGRSEEQVMEELGEPRLIARTIIDTTPGAGEGGFEEYRSFGSFSSGGYGGDSGSDGRDAAGRGEEDEQSRQRMSGNIHYYDLNKWYWKLLGVVLVIFIVTVLLMLIGGVLSIMIPLLPFFLVMMILMWFFRGPQR